MREHEMRQRVFRFLKARMRNMIMPATVGIGLAVGGCIKEGLTPVYSAPLSDGSPSVPIYTAPLPDGSTEKEDVAPGPDQALADVAREAMPEAVPVYGSDVSPLDLRKADGQTDLALDVATPPDGAIALDGAGIDGGKPDVVAPIDTGVELGGVKYMGPMPDASSDSGTATKYLAQIPDASALDGPAVRYMAQMPDSGGAAPLYLAQQPS